MNRFFKKIPGLFAILFITGVLTSVVYLEPVRAEIATPPALNGIQLNATQLKWVKYIAREVVPLVGADVAARGTWWSLEEGVLSLGSPIGYSNCAQLPDGNYVGNYNIEFYRELSTVCKDGVAWQVGLAAVQVPNNPGLEGVAQKARSLHSGMSLKEIIAQVSISAGHPQGTPQYNAAVNSSGYLQESLLLRDPATGFYFVDREVVDECLNNDKTWCNDSFGPRRSVIAKLAAYYKEANSGAAPTPPPADYKQCVAAGSADSGAGADPAAALTDEEQKEVPLGLPQQIGKFYSFALGIGALVALGVLIFGGILYTASAGNASRQDDAKQWLTGSIVGLIILFGSWFILNTVNPELTKLTDLRLLVNKAAEDSSEFDGGSSPYPVIDGQTCPVAPGFSYGSGCGAG
ncbi:hypothetical protein HYS42_00450, partial [Candidatus Saccharibacteria bacterium]|nr:hypothetical protein [Candidatus Saccharibacteria bacterium]